MPICLQTWWQRSALWEHPALHRLPRILWKRCSRLMNTRCPCRMRETDTRSQESSDVPNSVPRDGCSMAFDGTWQLTLHPSRGDTGSITVQRSLGVCRRHFPRATWDASVKTHHRWPWATCSAPVTPRCVQALFTKETCWTPHHSHLTQVCEIPGLWRVHGADLLGKGLAAFSPGTGQTRFLYHHTCQQNWAQCCPLLSVLTC